jgi:F420-dependent oxidoreductase-like protein
VRLDLGIVYWGLRVDAADQLEMTRAAEEAGYETVWAAEAYGSDAASILGWLAGQTSSIGLGAGIFQIPARSPAMTAMTAATLDRISGGRLKLGLGTSGPVVSEGWHGQRFSRQLLRTREYVEVVRRMLAREVISYDGETIQLPLPDGPGKPLKLAIGPAQERIPIYLGALGGKSLELTGEIADGWEPMFLSPAHYGAEFRPHLERGLARSGRTVADLDIVPSVQFCVDELDAARDAMRPFLALYIGGMGSPEHNFFYRQVCRYGFEQAAAEIQRLYLSGRKDEAAAALPDELIDGVSLCGPPERIRERLALFERNDIHHLVVCPAFGAERRDRVEQLQRLAEIAGIGARATVPA